MGLEKGLVKATYVSIWDSQEIRTEATYNPETGEIPYIQSIDVEGMDLEICENEYLELEDGNQLDVCLDCHEYVLRESYTDSGPPITMICPSCKETV